MKVVFLLEAGIPSYRNFLFNYLNDHPAITELLVIHTGRIYTGKEGEYAEEKVKFIGSNRLGMHIGILKFLMNADVVISSYNLRIVSCWLPAFFFQKKWIFWGKGLGEVESKLIFFLRKLTSEWCRYLLVYNEVKKQELVDKLNIAEGKIIAYQNSVFIDKPTNFKNCEKEYFLYFGRIQERKGLKELLNSYKNYRDTVLTPKYRLRIVGDGEFKAKLIGLASGLGITEWIDFCPGVYDEVSISQHFKNAIFYVSPFNVGLGVINSFAYGVPVITCEEPQIGPEFYYLNEQNSVIVENISKFEEEFYNIDQGNYKNFEPFGYYITNLHHKFMLNNFINTILKLKDE